VLAMAAAGVALMLGLGLCRPAAGDILLALGPAFLLGTAATVVVTIPLLVIGVALVPSFLAGVALAALIGFALARGHGWEAAEPRRPLPRLAITVLALLVAFGALGLLVALVHPYTVWDSWSIYGRKAIALANAGRLDVGFFSNPNYSFMHPDYPLLLPVLEAIEMKFGASRDGVGVVALPWLLFVAYAWTVVFVGVRVLHSRWAPVVVMALVLVPGGYTQALNGYADVPMAVFLGAGVLVAACWLRGGADGLLAAAALLLAAAASTKNEGLLAAGIVLALLIALGPGRRRQAALAALFVAVSVAIWRAWVVRHGIHGDVPFSRGLHPGYLADHGSRGRSAVTTLGSDAFSSQWTLILPAGIVAVCAGLSARTTRTVALFHALVGVGYFAALVWIYWISGNSLEWYLSSSGGRTVTPLAFVAISAVAHLSARTDRVSPAG